MFYSSGDLTPGRALDSDGQCPASHPVRHTADDLSKMLSGALYRGCRPSFTPPQCQSRASVRRTD
uniref:ORF64 n=1 Tax=Paenarthrobacter nicotinovorans TaxID=29320 RepID=Q93NH1_PAENI|nr:ORF64 [Paenarthrobacter nicotinovorans]CAD47948.1 hypothetical protein [Paenarthrobacter nicotinovorans]